MIKIEILTTGEELLDGRVLNSNLTFLGHHCHTLGLPIQQHVTIGDGAESLVSIFKERVQHATWILITGGLGPTDDDRTTACVAQAFGLPLVRDDKSVEAIEAYYLAKKSKNPQSNLKQAYFPQGATILENPLGTAPGFLLNINQTKLVVMPGVPSEMKHMFLTHIFPRLKAEADSLPLKTLCTTLKCAGAGESALADALKDIYPLPEGVELGYRAQVTEVHLQLIVQKQTLKEAETCRDLLVKSISQRCEQWLFPSSYSCLVDYVIDLLRNDKLSLLIAESCTGGLLTSWIVQQPGASDVLTYGIVAYNNATKIEKLNVDPELIDRYGAVSEEVAEAMLKGLSTQADSAKIAITGIAGPDGGTSEKPVGTVCIGVEFRTKKHIQTLHFLGDRQQIQQKSAATALISLLCLRKDYPLSLEQ